jgi:predicted AAA+ superfamily ATPase
LNTALREAPAVALEVAKSRPVLYLDLEAQSDRIKLTEPEQYLSQHEDKLVILDEVQRRHRFFEDLRGLIDAGRFPRRLRCGATDTKARCVRGYGAFPAG